MSPKGLFYLISMLKKLFISLASLLLSFQMFGQQLDSTKLAPLDSLLQKYYDAMLFEELPVKYAECDFLIESCKDSLVRQWVGTRILEHYMQDPPLMGEEAVALYLYDKWFASGKIAFADDWTEFQARLFAEFNRSSMLGMKAPVLMMYSQNEELTRVPRAGIVSVLYFYDTSCSKCKLISPVLPHLFDEISFPVTLFAIYTGSDAQEWQEFTREFTSANPYVTVVHLSDPEMESDYQKKYGVTSTPKIYFINPKGVIEGRRLDMDSLSQLIAIYETYSDYAKTK